MARSPFLNYFTPMKLHSISPAAHPCWAIRAVAILPAILLGLLFLSGCGSPPNTVVYAAPPPAVVVAGPPVVYVGPPPPRPAVVYVAPRPSVVYVRNYHHY